MYLERQVIENIADLNEMKQNTISRSKLFISNPVVLDISADPIVAQYLP